MKGEAPRHAENEEERKNTSRHRKQHTREHKHRSDVMMVMVMTVKLQSSRLCFFMAVCHFSPGEDDTSFISTLHLPHDSDDTHTQRQHMLLRVRDKHGIIYCGTSMFLNCSGAAEQHLRNGSGAVQMFRSRSGTVLENFRNSFGGVHATIQPHPP